MAKRDFYSRKRDFEPTEQQKQFAAELGVRVDMDMTRGQVSDLIDATLRAQRVARETEFLQKDRDALKKLIENGCTPGAVVKAWDWPHLIVRSLNADRGEIVCFGLEDRGRRHIFCARGVELITAAESVSDPEQLDAWMPSCGFVKLSPAEAEKILSGGDEKSISEIVIRDSFFHTGKNGRRCFLPKDIYESAIAEPRRKQAEQKIADIAAYRAAMDRKFCAVCGMEMHRLENVSIDTWAKVRRCESHRDTVQSQGDYKFCVRCGTRFPPRNANTFLCPSCHPARKSRV